MAGLTDMLGSLFDRDEQYNVPDFLGNLVGGVGDMVGGVGQMGAQAIDDPGSIPGMLGGIPGAMVGDIKRRYTQGDLAENIYEEPASFLFDLLDVGAVGKGASKALRSASKLPSPGGSRLSGLLADEAGVMMPAARPGGAELQHMLEQATQGFTPLDNQLAAQRLNLPETPRPMGRGLGSRLREMVGSEEGAITPGAEIGRQPGRFYETEGFDQPRHAPMPSSARKVLMEDIEGREGVGGINQDIESLEEMLADEFLEELAPTKDVYGGAMKKPPAQSASQFKRFLAMHPLKETLDGLYAARREIKAELTGDAYTAENYGPQKGGGWAEGESPNVRAPEPSGTTKKQTVKGLGLDKTERGAYWRDVREAAPEGSPQRTEATLQGRKEYGNLAPSREVKGRQYQGDIEGSGSRIIRQADREWLASNPSLRTDPEYHRLYGRARRALEGDVEVGSMLKELGGTRGRVGEVLSEGDYLAAVRELEDYVARRQEALPPTLSQRTSVDPTASTALPEDTGYVPGITEEGRLNPYGERLVSEQLLALRKQEPSSLKDYEQEIVSGGAKRRRKERIDPMLVNESVKPRRKGKQRETKSVDLLGEFDKGVVERMREAGISDERIAHILGGVKA